MHLLCTVDSASLHPRLSTGLSASGKPGDEAVQLTREKCYLVKVIYEVEESLCCYHYRVHTEHTDFFLLWDPVQTSKMFTTVSHSYSFSCVPVFS